MISIGTIARSCSSSTEKARSPGRVLISPVPRRNGSTCAVEDKASGMPMAIAAARLMSRTNRTSKVSTIPQAIT